MKFRLQRKKWLAALTAMGLATVALAQQPVRRPTRAERPEFKPGQFSGIFFDEVSSVVQGQPPAFGTVAAASSSGGTGATDNAAMNAAPDSGGAAEVAGDATWTTIISPSSIEDAVKGAKLRLDQIVTTPAKFAGGGYGDARREYSLLAMLFGIIAEYPGDIRWKESAVSARDRFARIAANSKVGSPQAYQEAKLRLQDLGDLLSGNQISDPSPNDEVTWDQIIDRSPIMQLLDWTYDKNLKGSTASKSEFEDSQDEVLRYAELVAAMSTVLKMDGMEDADSEDYAQWCNNMLQESMGIVKAVRSNNADLARKSAGQIGQACSQCHEVYR